MTATLLRPRGLDAAVALAAPQRVGVALDRAKDALGVSA